MSNFSYKDAKGNIVRLPVKYGDMTRQVAQIIKQNSENSIPSAPFIACYIKDILYDRTRLQDPTFVSKMHIRERAISDDGTEYLNIQGSNYTIERIMPSPFLITFAADIWTTNTEQKLQIWEQLVVLFNPSLELQTTDNYVDWTSLSLLTLESQVWSSRTIPQGLEQDIDILNMIFKAPIWITPPAKVKKLGVITKIISNVHAVAQGSILRDFSTPDAVEMFDGITPDAQIVITPGNFDLLVLNNVATLMHSNLNEDIDISSPQNIISWNRLLELHPGKFRAGLSNIRLLKNNGEEIVAYISLNPSNETQMLLNFDVDTVPENTLIAGRGTVDAIINPQTYNPGTPTTGIRYLILEDLNPSLGVPGYDGPDAWKNNDNSDFKANANDIIEWNGSEWINIFDSEATNTVTYITNSYTGMQYKWNELQWSKSFEGLYDKMNWRLVL